MRPSAALIVSAFAFCSFAQTTFDPFPNGSAAGYRFDLTHIFRSPNAEKSDRGTLEQALNDLVALQGHVADDGNHLLRALQLSDIVQTHSYRHYIYLDLRNAVDTRDAASRADAGALDHRVQAGTAFLRDELMRISDGEFTRFAAQAPELEKYLSGAAKNGAIVGGLGRSQ